MSNNNYSLDPKLNLYKKVSKTGKEYWAFCVELPNGQKLYGIVPAYYNIERINKNSK